MDGRRGGQRGSCNISGRVEFRFQILGVRLVRCFPGRSRTSPKGTTTSAPACRWGPRWGHPGPTCERAPPTPPPPRAAPSSQCPRKPGVLTSGHFIFFPIFGLDTSGNFIFFPVSIGHFIDVSRSTCPKGPRKGHSRLLSKHGEGKPGEVSLDGETRSVFSRGDSHSRRRETQARGRGWPG